LARWTGAAYIAQNPALSTATVFTIHNLSFRGLFPLDYHHDLGLQISGANQSASSFTDSCRS
jgi:glycogen synthase